MERKTAFIVRFSRCFLGSTLVYTDKVCKSKHPGWLAAPAAEDAEEDLTYFEQKLQLTIQRRLPAC